MSPDARHSSRRAVVRGAAWSVPVVSLAAAAPAFAASPCSDTYSYRMDWGTSTYTKDSVSSATAVAPTTTVTDGAPVTISIASSFAGGTDRRGPENLTVPAATNIGNLGAAERGLFLFHSTTAATRDSRQTVVFTFDRTISALAFTFVDVDSATNGWLDNVELSGTRTGSYNAANLTGSGTQAAPWRPVGTNTPYATTANSGNVSVSYSGSLTSITIDYYSTVAGSTQGLYLSDFTFTAKGCPGT